MITCNRKEPEKQRAGKISSKLLGRTYLNGIDKGSK
jgi:hypothetical protein